MTIMGPNDASGVVWALSEFFFLLLRVFLVLTNVYSTIYVSKQREGLVWAAMTVMGPNDASGVVWAIGKLFSCFFYTN